MGYYDVDEPDPDQFEAPPDEHDLGDWLDDCPEIDWEPLEATVGPLQQERPITSDHTPMTGMAHDRFHAHLDACDWCAHHPMELCPVGDQWLRATAQAL